MSAPEPELYRFECGCEFPILKAAPTPDVLPLLDIDTENLPLNCPATWRMLSEGKTRGVFQLEKQLGQEWSRKLKPASIEHLSALGALLRPGALNARDEDGVSATEHYCLRKNGLEEWDDIHPRLKTILEKTYGVLCLDPDALVALADGRHIPLRDVAAGMRVVSYDIAGDKFVAATCLGAGPTEIKEGRELVLENRLRLAMTDDHPVYTPDGFVRADSLRPGDLVATADDISSLQFSGSGGLADWLGSDDDVAYLLGYIVGNGCKGSSIIVCPGSRKRADIFAAFVQRSLPSLTTKVFFCTRAWYVQLQHPDLANNPLLGNRAKRFNQYLLDMGVRCLSTDKRVPPAVMVGTSSVRVSFLAGYYDADGTSFNGGGQCTQVNFCSASPGLLQDIRLLCSQLGIMTRVESDGNHLGVVNTQKFWDVLHGHCQMRTRGSGLTTGDCASWIPRAWIEPQRLPGESYTKMAARCGVGRRALTDKAPHCHPKTGRKCGVHIPAVKFHRIESVRPTSPRQWYGISVQEHHNLVANGIVVHNCYQEGFMRIASELAGFDLLAVDRLRKGIGKKDYAIISSLEKEFIDGCAKVGVLSDETARMVWSWIYSSGRYSFNQSHSTAYAMLGYTTAYLKCHFPVQFYAACLRVGCKDMDDVAILVNDAREFGVDVRGPHFAHRDTHCHTDGRAIYYGICDVKGVGDSAGQKFLEANLAAATVLGKPLQGLSWFEYLTHVLGRVEKPILYIRSGALDSFGVARSRMLAELDAWKTLTDSEREWVLEAYRLQACPEDQAVVRANLANLEGRLKELDRKNPAHEEEILDLKESVRLDRLRLHLLEHGFAPFQSMETALESLGLPKQPPKPKTKAEAMKPQPTGPFGGCSKEERRDIVLSLARQLRNPPTPFVDSPRQIAMEEEDLLGLPVSCFRLDQCDLSEANTTIQRLKAGEGRGESRKLLLGVEVVQVRPTVTKKGQNPGQEMARLSLADRTGSIEAVCFPEVWAKVRGLVSDGAMLLMHVQRDKKNDLSVIVLDAWPPRPPSAE